MAQDDLPDAWHELQRSESHKEVADAWAVLREDFHGEDFRNTLKTTGYESTTDHVLLRKTLLSLMNILDVPPNGKEMGTDFEWATSISDRLFDEKADSNWHADFCHTIRTLRDLYGRDSEFGGIEMYQMIALNSLDVVSSNVLLFTDGIPIDQGWWVNYIQSRPVAEQLKADGKSLGSSLKDFVIGDRALIWHLHQALEQEGILVSVDNALARLHQDGNNGVTIGYIGIKYIDEIKDGGDKEPNWYEFVVAHNINNQELDPTKSLSREQRLDFYGKGLCLLAIFPEKQNPGNGQESIITAVKYAERYKSAVIAAIDIDSRSYLVYCTPSGDYLFLGTL